MNPSDAPVPTTGTRTRSGNAMARTRAAILDAAQRSVEKNGVRKTTMSEVAATAAVAKATLYNHFRTKEDVLAALVEARVTELGEQAAEVAGGQAPRLPGQLDPGAGLAAALVLVTDALAHSVAVRRLAEDEPGILARLAAPASPGSWTTARASAAGVLSAAGLDAGEVSVTLVLRHVVSQLLWPSTGEDSRFGAQLLEKGLRTTRPPIPAVAPDAEPAVRGSLGWPG